MLWSKGRHVVYHVIFLSPGSLLCLCCIWRVRCTFLVLGSSEAIRAGGNNELVLTLLFHLCHSSRLWPIRPLSCSWEWIHLDSWITLCQQCIPKWPMHTWSTCGRAPVRYRRTQGLVSLLRFCAVPYMLPLHVPHRTKARLEVLLLHP